MAHSLSVSIFSVFTLSTCPTGTWGRRGESVVLATRSLGCGATQQDVRPQCHPCELLLPSLLHLDMPLLGGKQWDPFGISWAPEKHTVFPAVLNVWSFYMNYGGNGVECESRRYSCLCPTLGRFRIYCCRQARPWWA